MNIPKRYDVLRHIGAGGMGDVVLAFDNEREINVAVKSLKTDLIRHKDFIRFQREFSLAKEISHPNIVKVFDADLSGEDPYFTMEYCKNGDLTAIASETFGNPALVWDVVSQIGAGLARLHSETPRIIHRDLKPQNILIGDDYSFKISDFGLSRKITDKTITSSNWGSQGFTAPEQFNFMHGVDQRADLYSLGAITYYLMTNETPSYFMKLQNAILKDSVLDPIVRCLLQHEPSNRFDSIRMLKYVKSEFDDLINIPNVEKFAVTECYLCDGLAFEFKVKEREGSYTNNTVCLDPNGCEGRK